MSALLKMEMYEVVAEAAVAKRAGWIPEVIVTVAPPASEEKKLSRAKSVALFLASPFIGLAYVVAMPFVAIAMLAWFAGKALAAKAPASVKKACMMTAAPFIGLAFILTLPLTGIAALGYYALKAAQQA